MNTTRHAIADLLNRIAAWLGLDLTSDLSIGPVDEREVAEQLHYGRD
jgi:hypothetical protein